MRIRDSENSCARVCYIQSATHKHNLENKVKNTFTYVREQECEYYSLKENLLSASKDLAVIELILKGYDSAQTEQLRREIHTRLKNSLIV